MFIIFYKLPVDWIINLVRYMPTRSCFSLLFLSIRSVYEFHIPVNFIRFGKVGKFTKTTKHAFPMFCVATFSFSEIIDNNCLLCFAMFDCFATRVYRLPCLANVLLRYCCNRMLIGFIWFFRKYLQTCANVILFVNVLYFSL